jgi:hypothetical protein
MKNNSSRRIRAGAANFSLRIGGYSLINKIVVEMAMNLCCNGYRFCKRRKYEQGFQFKGGRNHLLAETGEVETGKHAADLIGILIGQESHDFDLWKKVKKSGLST